MSITEDPTGTLAPLSPPPLEDGAHLCVLASGSAGNCSVLVLRRRGQVRALLLDLGLSPRRTFRLLSEMGLGPHQLDGALVTHLDHDHLHAGWRTQMPGHARVHMHEHHADRVADGRWVVTGFDGAFDLDPDVRVRPLMMSHDEQGVATFRIDFTDALARERARVSLGFATDLGHIHARMVDHFRGTNPSGNASDGEVADDPVDVLAIESNYCPVMQHASTRSDFLKQRIMGGHGHLSNQEALSAVLQVEPRDHVVLLHLSRECNDPAVVAALHAGADYALTITSQERPSRWVRIGGTSPRELRPCARPSAALSTSPRPATLWDHAEPRA
jgi:hypothetical protein